MGTKESAQSAHLQSLFEKLADTSISRREFLASVPKILVLLLNSRYLVLPSNTAEAAASEKVLEYDFDQTTLGTIKDELDALRVETAQKVLTQVKQKLSEIGFVEAAQTIGLLDHPVWKVTETTAYNAGGEKLIISDWKELANAPFVQVDLHPIN